MKVSLDGCQGKILLRKYDCSARLWVFKLSVGGQVADIRNTKRKYKHKPLLNFIQSNSPPAQYQNQKMPWSQPELLFHEILEI